MWEGDTLEERSPSPYDTRYDTRPATDRVNTATRLLPRRQVRKELKWRTLPQPTTLVP
jgi:hypothetical protein